jgi:glycolate oxidase FAD binding subunit
MTTYRPSDAAEVREVVAAAAAAGRPLEVLGRGSKRNFGRPIQTEDVLDLSAMSGIVDYESSELVLTARAATLLSEIEAAVAERRQMLAFEPPDWSSLLRAGPAEQTLGGVLASNLSGPRRFKAGAARDHFLGFHAVNGRGEAFKAGGKVVKNVTGYDLPKLMAGSFGTLAVLTEVTIKVLPRPEKARTILLFGADAAAGIEALTGALNSSHEVSGAAYLPAAAASRSAVSHVVAPGRSVTAVRVEGPGPSVVHRGEQVRASWRDKGPTEELHTMNSQRFWREVANVSPLAGLNEQVTWRISIAPSAAAGFISSITQAMDVTWYADWGGGLIWIAIRNGSDGGADALRSAFRVSSGHATLIAAPVGLRAAIDVFQPLAPALAQVTARVKVGFDPCAVLNPGRMYRQV